MKTVKRILYVIGGIALFVIGASISIGYLYGPEIKKYVIQELNKKLNAEVSIEKVDFTLLENFPNATVNFKNVKARSAYKGKEMSPQDLFECSEISLLFNIKDLFSKNYSVKKFLVEKGKLNLFVDSKGLDNYHFWKNPASDDSKSNFTFKLNKVQFKDFQLNFINHVINQREELYINKLLLNGDLNEKSFSLKVASDIKAIYLGGISQPLIQNKNIELDLTLLAEDSQYNLKEGRLKLEDLSLNASGKISKLMNGFGIDLKINSEELDIASILSLLPENIAQYKGNYNSTGKISFESTVSGISSASELPQVQGSFSVDKAKIEGPSDIELENIKLQGKFFRPSRDQSKGYLKFNDFSFTLKNKTLTGAFVLNNPLDPEFSGGIKGEIDLENIFQFLKLENLSGSGSVNIDLACTGKLKTIDSLNNRPKNIHAQGEISLNNLALKLNNPDVKLKEIFGNVVFTNDKIELKDVNGRINQSDLHLNGNISNLLSFFDENPKIKLDGELVSHKINVEDFLFENHNSIKDSVKKNKTIPFTEGTISINVGELTYKKVKLQSLKGAFFIDEGSIVAKDVSMKTMDGNVSLDGSVLRTSKDSLLLSCNAHIGSVNVRELFYEFENFGQKNLIDKNVQGKLTADLKYMSVSTTDLDIDPSKMYLSSDLVIQEGELIDYKPMMALSKFVKLSELKDVKFNTLNNHIEVRDRKIIIPSMEIRSNAISMTAAGNHTFDNTADYRLVILLNETLGKKAKQKSEFGDIADDGTGKWTLPLKFTGPMNDPKISYDRLAVAQKIKSDVKTEKQNLKNILKEEFNWLNKDQVKITTVSSTSEPEIDISEKQNQPKNTNQNHKGKFAKLKDLLKEKEDPE